MKDNISSGSETLLRIQMLDPDKAVTSHKNKWYMKSVYGNVVSIAG